MRLIIDQNVPEAVVEYLATRGHEITRIRDLSLAESPDVIVAAIGDQNDAIVVTWDRDFRSIASKIPRGYKGRFRRLGRILFCCSEPRGRSRIEQVVESIDFEFAQAQKRADTRLIVEIGTSHIRFEH